MGFWSKILGKKEEPAELSPSAQEFNKIASEQPEGMSYEERVKAARDQIGVTLRTESDTQEQDDQIEVTLRTEPNAQEATEALEEARAAGAKELVMEAHRPHTDTIMIAKLSVAKKAQLVAMMKTYLESENDPFAAAVSKAITAKTGHSVAALDNNQLAKAKHELLERPESFYDGFAFNLENLIRTAGVVEGDVQEVETAALTDLYYGVVEQDEERVAQIYEEVRAAA